MYTYSLNQKDIQINVWNGNIVRVVKKINFITTTRNFCFDITSKEMTTLLKDYKHALLSKISIVLLHEAGQALQVTIKTNEYTIFYCICNELFTIKLNDVTYLITKNRP